MKKNGLFLFVFHCLNVFPQNTTEFKFVPYEKLKKYEYQEGKIDVLDCDQNDIKTQTLLFEILTFDPAYSDETKNHLLKNLDAEIDKLQKFSTCKSIQTLILYVGEGAFIRESDNIVLDSKKYRTKYCRINAERFWQRYKSKLTAWFPNKTILYVDWYY